MSERERVRKEGGRGEDIYREREGNESECVRDSDR